MAVTFWVGSNMPGYMPDSEPYGSEDFVAACSALIDDLEQERDAIDTEGGEDAGDEITVIDGAINAIELARDKGHKREFHIYVRHRHFYLETY